MGYLRLLLPLILMLLAACDSSPLLTRLPPNGVILAFGDSLTYGSGVEAEQSYPAVLEGLSGHSVINAGRPGEISAEGLARLPGLLDDEQPALLILCHGGNDMLRQLDLKQAEANIRAMINAAKSRGIQVVLIGVPRPGVFLGTAELYERIADDMKVPFAGEALSDILGDRKLKSDQIHPNAAGYQKLAESIFDLLKNRGAL